MGVRRRTFRLNIESPTWPASVIAGAYGLLGLAMLGQPHRFVVTAPFGILLDIMPIRAWGAAHLAVAALFLLYVAVAPGRTAALAAHIAGFVLTTLCLIAFVVRYITDPGTTPTNAISWLVYLFVLARSASLIPRVTARHGTRRGSGAV